MRAKNGKIGKVNRLNVYDKQNFREKSQKKMLIMASAEANSAYVSF